MSLFKNYTADEFYRIGAPPAASRSPKSATQTVAGEPDTGPGFIDYAKDALLGVPRGLLGGLSDIADLATTPFGYDTPDYFGLASPSETMAGSITEGISNFLTGFVPGLGIASKVGKIGKVASVATKVKDMTLAAQLAGNTARAGALKGVYGLAKGSVAGAVADFAAFDGHEERLSNLLRDYAGLQDPLTQFLAADPNDGEVMGRFKNAIEGLAIGGLTEGIFNAFRVYRAGYLGKMNGVSPDEAMALESVKIRTEQRELFKKYIPNATDQQADVANWLIDQYGIDRSKLEIVGGEEAKRVYQEFGGMALEQRSQWNTPEFKTWFGNSRVVDKKGNPLVVYHGAGADFTAFDMRRGGQNYGLSDTSNVMWFTTDSGFASGFADVAAITEGDRGKTWRGEWIRDQKTGEKLVATGANTMPVYLSVEKLKLINTTPGEKAHLQIAAAMAEGYEGVRFKSETGNPGSYDFVIFSPEKVKSAIANEGTFSKTTPDILKQGTSGEVRGFAAFAEDGRRVIGFLNSPDFSTAVEEISHVGRRQLFDKDMPQAARMGISNEDIDAVAKWSGATEQDGRWTWDVAAEEKFAKGFQKYLRDGEAPAGLEGLFKEVTNWMIALYRDLTGSDLDLTVSKEVKDVFDKIMTRGPGFDNVAPKALGGAQLLRQAAPAPGTLGTTDVPPGNVGLGKPGGIPEEALNIERISSSTQAAQYLRGVIQAERATMADAPLKLEDVAAQAKTVSEDLAKYIPGVDPLDLQRNLSTNKTSAWQLRDASIELQAMRKYESSGGQRLFELSSKGSAASPMEMYEFLMGETAIKTISHQIKQRSREIARALVSMKIVPVPEKTFSFLPPLTPAAAPTPGSVVPPAAAGAPSPAAAIPSPAAAVPSPAALAPTPGVITGGMDKTTQEQIIRQVIDQAGGEDAVRGRMARYTAAYHAAGSEGVLRLSGGKRGILPALTEYWMNSILSGPITHMVNMTSNMLTAMYLPAERALGATVRGDWKTAGNAMREYIYLFQEFDDARRLAVSALKMDDNILTKAGTAERDMVGRAISAEGLGLTEGTMGAMAANWIGKVLNIPTRMLAAEDEFFKQLTYRAHFKTELYIEGMSRFNGDSRAAAQWAETTFEKTLVDGQAYAESVVAKRAASAADRAVSEGTITAAEKGDYIARYMSNEENWDPSLGVLSQRALDRTNYATFSTKLDPNSPKAVLKLGASVQNLVNKNPYMRFILPFVRTPANILSFTLDRSVIGASTPANLKTAFGEYRSLLTHPDAAIRADAAGRFAFAAGTAATIGLLASTGAITGGGPKNKAERELKIQSGWQPYSIRVGDTYYSYRRLDPFSSVLGLIADISEGFQYAESRSIPLMDAVLNASILSIARNLTNKSYLTGITNVSNALSNPEQFGQMLANQYVSSMLPFSSALSQSVFSVSGDPVARDVRTMLDAVRAKIPYIAEGVAPKRNILGEVIETPNRGVRGLALLNPVSYTDVTDDKILQEFDLLGHGFTPPKEQRGALDLTTFKTTGGQQAYDRWLELHGQVKIGGKTLRQALTKMIGSRDYQKLSPSSTDDYDSPRIRQIRTTISKYREEAYKQLLKEAPELRQASRIDFANKQALRMGRSVQELIDLGNR